MPNEPGMKPYSLRRRLLLWLLMATAVLGLLALVDTWREALRTAQSVSDRVLVGSALAIAERVTVDESGGLEVDIPFSSLEMLASTAQDKVFYRVDGPVGHFLTGYDDLAVVSAPPGGVGFADGVYGNVGIRSATLLREVSTGSPFSDSPPSAPDARVMSGMIVPTGVKPISAALPSTRMAPPMVISAISP